MMSPGLTQMSYQYLRLNIKRIRLFKLLSEVVSKNKKRMKYQNIHTGTCGMSHPGCTRDCDLPLFVGGFVSYLPYSCLFV